MAETSMPAVWMLMNRGVGDLPVGQARGDQREHFPLGPGEAEPCCPGRLGRWRLDGGASTMRARSLSRSTAPQRRRAQPGGGRMGFAQEGGGVGTLLPDSKCPSGSRQWA
jgi:hypothetical protein